MKKRKLKNLLNPTPQQIKHRAELWAQALEENPRKTTGTLYSSFGGRCCLAVAQDVAASCGVNIPPDYLQKGDDSYGDPHKRVGLFFGWNSNDPELKCSNGVSRRAAGLNDNGVSGTSSRGASHKTIAKAVRRTFIENS